MWTRENYEKAADQIAKDFAAGSGTVTINQLSTKVATDGGLNPDGIRTLVRLANTNAFQELFAKHAGQPDRMFEFETGDPEIIIANLYNEEKVACTTSVDLTGYDHLQDYYGSFSVKTAEDMGALEEDEEEEEEEEECGCEDKKPCDKEDEAPVLDKNEVKNLFDRTKEKIESEKKAEELRWGMALESAATVTKDIIGREFNFDKVAFYRDVLAASNGTCYEDLQGLHFLLTGAQKADLFNGEKVASVVDTTAPILTKQASLVLSFLEKARNARYNWCAADTALEMLNGMAH